LLFGLVLCGVGLLWWRGYACRLEASAILSEQTLYRQSAIEKVDAMTGAEFEQYCALLLRLRGYQNVLITGSTNGDQGVDVIADTPDGVPMGVQCKRWKSRSVGDCSGLGVVLRHPGVTQERVAEGVGGA
jgi:Restriction endonuclease